ncbi:MAG: SDR family oxidoreductase [Opitutaceae bacterium]
MKTTLITGADKGLGLGHVQHCLAQGYRVLATSRRPESSSDFADLKTQCGERFLPLRLDMRSDDSIAALGSLLEGITLDLVINNAGISVEEGLGGWTSDSMAAHFRVNATGPALLVQELDPFINEGAKIINVSSGMASLEYNINATAGLDAYAMSKAALNMLSRRLAEKLKPRKVIVVALSPGWVQTAMGGSDAPSTVTEAVESMQKVIASLELAQSGSFLSELGETLPW